jgi:polyphosphate kinase
MILKCNAVTDPAIVRTLYKASQAGVDIDMIVRGACVLRPGIPGVSERIRVKSVVGRFLEHSRAYYFENGGEPELYIGSADLMERNLDRRVETLCRVRDTSITQHIRAVVLDAYLRDNARAYVLVNDEYRKTEPSEDGTHSSAQQLLLGWYGSNPTVHEENPGPCVS